MRAEYAQYAQLVCYTLAGVVLGRMLNAVNLIIDSHFPTRKPLSLLLQTMTLASVPFILDLLHLQQFVSDWQESLNGLYFTTGFLSMQTSLTNTALLC